mmetsp:Transcript_4389/g.8921  ORF Transcript_4389/g.8921 Transcript_4389/m.8921 type:complete len:147 (-) Transcript_4389:139-579(-)
MYHWHRRSTGAHASISFAAFSLDFLFPFLLFLLSLFSLFFLFCMSWPRTVNLLHRSSDDDAINVQGGTRRKHGGKGNVGCSRQANYQIHFPNTMHTSFPSCSNFSITIMWIRLLFSPAYIIPGYFAISPLRQCDLRLLILIRSFFP